MAYVPLADQDHEMEMHHPQFRGEICGVKIIKSSPYSTEALLYSQVSWV